jgi:hypothetical protein
MPCGQWTTDSQSIAVVSSIQVTDRKHKEFFETIDGWKGIYNLEKSEVFQVLDTGKVSAASSNTASTFLEIRSNGEEAQTLWCWQGNRKPEAEQVESSFNVSFDNFWLVINRHVSTGGYLEFGRQKEEEIYTLAGSIADENDGGVAALAFKHNGLNAEDYMGDHFSYSFKGWDDAPNRIIVGFDSRLSVRDKDRNFLHLTGWSGVYDLYHHEVVSELSSGAAEAFDGERFPQIRQRLLTKTDIENSSYAQLRYAINETYARHGATFHDQAIEKQFQQFAWYKPHPERSIEQIEKSFSDQEKKNIDLVKELMDSKRDMH